MGADLHFVVRQLKTHVSCYSARALPKEFAIVARTLVECSYLVHSRHDILPHREGGARPEVGQAVDREDVEIAQPIPAAPNRSQNRIPSTDPHPVSMGTK